MCLCIALTQTQNCFRMMKLISIKSNLLAEARKTMVGTHAVLHKRELMKIAISKWGWRFVDWFVGVFFSFIFLKKEQTHIWQFCIFFLLPRFSSLIAWFSQCSSFRKVYSKQVFSASLYQKAVVNGGCVTSPGANQINLVTWASQLKEDSANYRHELIPHPQPPLSHSAQEAPRNSKQSSD